MSAVPKAQVLVLDDDEAARELVSEVLGRAGYTVVALAVGAEALARLPEIDPGVIVLDMMMPHMDGFEFLARLRASSARPDVPVLVRSDLGEFLAETVDASASRTLGLAGILPKDSPLSVLVAHVRRVIGPPRTSREPAEPAGD